MIERIIDWCTGSRFLVFTGTVVLTLWGIWAMTATPVDAVPDISDVQVIVSTEWMGRSPDLIEDQVTYPIVSALISTPRVRTVRGFTDFGISYVYVIFQDGTDMYWARSRVVEYLQGIRGQLPDGVNPVIGPDATGVGWVFEYALVDESGRHTLADLRGLQDWYLRYWLAAVPGVAEVASIGGYVKQYQVNLDPNKLAAYDLAVKDVVRAIQASNNEVEGRLLEFAGREYMVRGRGYLQSAADIESVSLGATPAGTPVRVSDVAEVRLGPDIRRGVAELDGQGEVVGGIVVMRFGENALDVIDRVKAKLRDVAGAPPEGVRIVPTYDRSWLIGESIATLRRTLIEEAIVVSIVIIVFLFHFRSALIPILALPVAVVASFIPMLFLDVTSNIMSLGGLALAIGVLVDASIVMVENAYRHVSEPGENGGAVPAYEQQPTVVTDAAKQVGRAIFFSLAIIVISFIPVFLLEAQEGRMFRPLAFTKTFAMVFASILSITLVPVLMTMFIRGRKLRPESANPVSRFFTALYGPLLRLALRWKWAALAVNFAVVPLTVPLLFGIGREFMPPLYEGSFLYMPTAPPGMSISEATRILQVQDKLLQQFPEVERVFGTVGRGIGGYVERAKQAIVEAVPLPPGYTLLWTGQYEFQIRARERLQVLVPIVFFIIFMLLYMTFHSVAEAMIVMLSVVYAMTGGVILQWLLGYNFSVAVWVGYIALYGVAVQTGVVMVVYLHEALDRRLRQRQRPARGAGDERGDAGPPSASERGWGSASTEEAGVATERDIWEATLAGSVLRLRPKLMTVSVVMAGLLPIMWSSGVGSDVMKPIAAPIIGGMVTSTIHVLIITPVIFYMMKVRAWRAGRLRLSRMTR